MPKNNWSQQDIKLLKEIYANTKFNELEKIFNRKYWLINTKANKLGLKKNVSYNDSASFLLSNTLEVFYWIGFILADGHISNDHRLTIKLGEIDRNHLEKLAIKLNNTAIKTYKTSKNSFKLTNYVRLSIMDTKNITQLSDKFDISNNKTINPPNISNYDYDNKLIMSLILGFIDGDGSIAKRGYALNRHYIRLKCHQKWLENLAFIGTFISNFFGIKTKMTSYLNKQGYATITISNNKIIHSLKHFALKNNLPIMERKWDKITIENSHIFLQDT